MQEFKILLPILLIMFMELSAAWSPPYFEKIDPRIKVTYTENLPDDFITITMPEEISTPVAIALFKDYDHADGPMLGSFMLNTASNLGLSFNKNNAESQWQMLINQRQDYENSNTRDYSFYVHGNVTRLYVMVKVQNIFDNPPTMTQVTNPCYVKENNEENFESHCIFNVHDIDGMENNTITFSPPNDIFDFNRISSTEFDASYSLIIKKILNYDDSILYMFQVNVLDIANNNSSMNAIVNVENIPLRPPTWTRPFASARFLEETNQTIKISAVDGDRGINTTICYKVHFESEKNYNEIISIPDNSTGTIMIEKIDRDEWGYEIFPFNIIAYKCNNESSFIENSAVLIVDDINDNFPEISFDENDKGVIEIWESEITTLFLSSELSVNDIDLGSNALYSVSLSSLLTGISDAFNIVPTSGYQLGNFTISVVNPALLDYDKNNGTLANFTITITAMENQNATRFREKDFRVILKNWNDEIPIFNSLEYSFEVSEDVGDNFVIGLVNATDLDIDDVLVYYINGRTNEIISIDSNTGEIKTAINSSNSFDYERQTDQFFQVFVRDTLITSKNEPTHTAFTQVHITILDVNDTPPQLIMPQGGFQVEENDKSWEAIIEAFDPDTTADLDFFILWENSSVSGSSNTKPENYIGSLKITKINDTDINRVRGILSVDPIFEGDIDYELYNFMYIMIGVIDKGTDAKYSTSSTAYAVLTIEVLDVNDNPPIFMSDTLSVKRRVIENAEEGIFIGSIMATDADGPNNNNITFTMTEIGNNTDNTDWLKIDSLTGEITVNKGDEIDCDVPVRQSLNYTITLSDGVHETKGNISIIITDINDNIPQIDDYTSVVKVYENVTDIFITKVLAHDDDRDPPNNDLIFYITTLNPGDSFFEINAKTGELRVKALNETKQMDRDHGITSHSIQINVEDSNGIGLFNRNSTTVQLILLDCNDNAPEMPSELLLSPVFESFLQNTVINANFYAPDIDEGKNAEVDYVLQDIVNVEFYGEGDPVDFKNLFKIENHNKTLARFSTEKDLRGFSGKWNITITATDKGSEIDGGYSQTSSATYSIEIEPFNFDAPRIIFPVNNEIIRIDYNNLKLDSQLFLLDKTSLKFFEAIDYDVKLFGDVTFEIDSGNGDHDYFDIIKNNTKQSQLQIKRNVAETTYIISLKAVDGGGRESSSITVQVVFVNSTSDPIFNQREFLTDFTENELGMSEIRTIPKAEDPKSNGVDWFNIFYYIDQNYNSVDVELFGLNKTTGELKLTKSLDREKVDRYEIRVIASNSAEYNQIIIDDASENSILYVKITVNDVNDNSPKFEYASYAVGISESDDPPKTLLTLYAADADLNDKISYYILNETLEVSDESLNEYKYTAFVLNSNTGFLTSNFKVQESMTGFFSFKVQAIDLANHTDEALVKVYTVAERHRVTFIFFNTTEQVNSVNLQGLIEIFHDAYEAECISDDIRPHQLKDGNIDERKTNFRVHFMRDGEAVEKEEIFDRSLQVNFLYNISSRLIADHSILFYDIVMPDNTNEVGRKTLEISLAIVSGILGLLLITLIAFHVHQTRKHHRVIKALSQTAYDPTLYNKKKAVPNTNTHAIEKSNPMMIDADLQNVMYLDTKSIISTGSDDFAGLDDNPIFDISSKVDGNSKSTLEKSDSFA